MHTPADLAAATASNSDACLIRIERSPASWKTMLGGITALSMVLALCGGTFLLTSQALSEPEAVNLAFAHPWVTLQIVAGLLLLSTLVLIPVRRLVARIGSAGVIEIDGRNVHVRQKSGLATRAFTEPLDAYRGIAHRIRTTLSGIQHELVLVHPDARRDVVIGLDGTRPDLTAAGVMTQLRLPEIAPGDIRRTRRAGTADRPRA